MKKALALSGLFIFLFVSAASWADSGAPNTIYYERSLSEAITSSAASMTFTFSLYDAPKDGKLLWSETKQIDVTPRTRLIPTNIGDTNALSLQDLAPQMWLEVSYINDQGGNESDGQT